MIRILGLMILLCSATGCGSNGGAVSGAVTLNGQPLTKGVISFSGESGSAGTGGGSIVAGKYEVKNLRPGKYHVHIAGEPENKFIAPDAPEAQRTLTEAEIRALSDPLPVGTTGTDATVEVKGGAQTLDFALQAPSGT